MSLSGSLISKNPLLSGSSMNLLQHDEIFNGKGFCRRDGILVLRIDRFATCLGELWGLDEKQSA
jgi:hypothetical protein